MKREITLELLSAVNPAPRPDQLTDSLGIADDALLHLIEQRSAAMSTSTEHEHTRNLPDLGDDTETGRRVPGGWRGWRIAAVAFAVVLIAGVAVAIIALTGLSSTPATASFGLVGGEDVNDLDGNFGWTFEGTPLISINSPGPTLEVEVGTEVTLTFTNVSGWSDTSPQDAIAQSFRIVPTIPSAETLFGADTGLVDVGESATITFVADQIGEFRYLSDGLGMAPGRGMFGRFVVVEESPSESEVVGRWSSGDTTLELDADGTFTFTSAEGSSSGLYQYETAPRPVLVMFTAESTIPDEEYDGEPCLGRDVLSVSGVDETALSIALSDDHLCGGWLPGFITLNRSE